MFDRRRANYAKAHEWLRVYLRYSLAFTMISYGAYKVIKSQFPNPGLFRLLEPYGSSSPMGLLWTFMGYSTLAGVMQGDTIWAALVRRNEKEFLLLRRGFHWISEYPFNR